MAGKKLVVVMSPNVPTGGLLGLYYPGPTIEGAPVLERVDQTVDTYYQTPPPNTQFPFSARWLGTLNAATGGLYQFALDSTGPSRLYIDGALVVAGGPGASATTATATLRPGLHLIRVDYNATGSYLHCYLTWAPPGQSALSALPPSATQPAHG